MKISRNWETRRKKIKGQRIGDGLLNNNTYNINLCDGEEHYLLLHKQYDNQIMTIRPIVTSAFDSLFSNNSSSVPVEQSLFDQYGVKFEVKLVDIIHNGVPRQAIRLSGGTDYIEYDRVKFPGAPVIKTVVYKSVDSDTVQSTSYQNIFERNESLKNYGRYGNTNIYLDINSYREAYENAIRFQARMNGLIGSMEFEQNIRIVVPNNISNATEIRDHILKNSEYGYTGSFEGNVYTAKKILEKPMFDSDMYHDNLVYYYNVKHENHFDHKIKKWDNDIKYWKPSGWNLEGAYADLYATLPTDKNGTWQRTYELMGEGGFYFHSTDRISLGVIFDNEVPGTNIRGNDRYYRHLNYQNNPAPDFRNNIQYTYNNYKSLESQYPGQYIYIKDTYNQTFGYDRISTNNYRFLPFGTYDAYPGNNPYTGYNQNNPLDQGVIKILHQEFDNKADAGGKSRYIFGEDYRGRTYVLQKPVFYWQRYMSSNGSYVIGLLNLNKKFKLNFETDSNNTNIGTNTGKIDDLLIFPLWYKIEDQKYNNDGNPISGQYEEVNVRFPYWDEDKGGGRPMPTWDSKLINENTNNKYTKRIDIIISDYRNSSNAEESVKYTLNITCEIRASHMSNTDGKTDIDTGKTFAQLEAEGYNINGTGGSLGFDERNHVWRKKQGQEPAITIPPNQ